MTRHLGLIVVFLCAWSAAWAQGSDFQVRLGAGVKQDLPKGLDLRVGYQLRLDHGAQAFMGSYVTADLGYGLRKHLTAIFETRFATSTDWDKLRLGVGLQWKDKLMKKTDYSVKLRYQREHYFQSWPEIGQYPDRNNLRLKLEVERKLAKRLYLHISTEPQVRIEGAEGGFQRVRNVAGLEWEFIKRNHVDLSYYYQPEFKQGNLDFTQHMALVTYRMDLRKWWKKGKEKDDGDHEK